jgi:hypothetical protein
VKRTAGVAALAALAAGLAATLAAFGGRPAGPSPDPQQARDDGCVRDYFGETRRELPTWVYVNDHSYPAGGPPPPPQRLQGRVTSRHFPDLAVHPTEEDLPPVHRAYDFNFDALPDSAYTGLLGGDPALRTGNFAGSGPSTGRVHVEREQTALPRFAWPERGDRVALVGSWIWDCGHWTPAGERTELHSYRALWLVRNPGGVSPLSPYGEAEGDLYVSNDKTYAGVEADCAHQTKGNRVAFRLCLSTESEWLDLRGTYRFELTAPPAPRAGSRLIVRVLDARSTRGAPRPRITVHGRKVNVTLTVRSHPASKLVIASRVLAGWSGAPVPEHLRIRFTRLLVRRAMDPGCPLAQPTCGSKETTLGEQTSTPPGEWNVYLDAAGAWTVWGKGLIRAYDRQVFRRGPALDVYVPRSKPWRLFVFTRECDFGVLDNADGPGHAMTPCPRSKEIGQIDGGDDVPGFIVKRFASPAASLGSHRGRPSWHDTTCPRANRLGCYELGYSIARIQDDRTRRRGVVVSASDERRN